MRNIMLRQTPVLIGLVLIALFFIQRPVGSPHAWLYNLVRQVIQVKMNFDTRDMLVLETDHFIIKYTAADASIIAMVADAAEKSYAAVPPVLGYVPAGKTLVIVHPERHQMRQAFGQMSDQNAMGIYWGGVIQVLSPRVWLKDQQSENEFIHSGPMLHEYTHLVLDYETAGNYSRWFTEGLAQYMEYRINHYEWLTKNNSLAAGKLYSMAELDKNFDGLDNQSLSYRESLAAVRYIAEVHGDAKLQQLIEELRAGQNIQKAIQDVLGMDYAAYEAAWQKWALIHMTNS